MIPDSISWCADPFSCMSHLVAAFVFLVLGAFLLKRGRTVHETGCLITYVLSVVLLLSLSGAYHLLPRSYSSRYVLRHLDHAAIFLLIAGTFTGVYGMLYKGRYRSLWLVVVWLITVTAIILKMVYFRNFPETLSISLYLGFGWAGVLWTLSIWKEFGFSFIQPLIMGGVAFTAGAILEYIEEPILIQGVVGPHELFHVAVLLGIALHWRFISSTLGFQYSSVRLRSQF